MKKTLKLMPEYQCYPLWLYDSDGTLIDNIIPESLQSNKELMDELYQGILSAEHLAPDVPPITVCSAGTGGFSLLFSPIRVQYKDTDRSRIRSHRSGHRKGEDQ